jgi:hypothetical protein
MISVKFELARQNSRAAFALIIFLTLGVLTGCGAGWQPDRDTHQDQIRPGAEGSGLKGPADDYEVRPESSRER